MDSSKKRTYIVAAAAFVLIVASIYFLFVRQKGDRAIKPGDQEKIVKDISEIDIGKRPFVTLTPTSDGAEIIIAIEKMSDFDKIEYELTYLADNPLSAGEKIERGATGSDINSKDEKYKKSILLGTGSKGVRSPDKGITDGKLTLHLFKSDTEYQSETNWDMFESGSKTTTLKSRDDKFEITIPAFERNYWLILADTVGMPPKAELEPQKIILPIYGAFSIAPDIDKAATIKFKLDGPEGQFQLKTYLHQNSRWDETIDVSLNSSQEVTSKVKKLATYVVSSK